MEEFSYLQELCLIVVPKLAALYSTMQLMKTEEFFHCDFALQSSELGSWNLPLLSLLGSQTKHLIWVPGDVEHETSSYQRMNCAP